MKCEDYLILIDELVEGELEEGLAEQVNSHLLDCGNCAAGYEDLRQEKELYGQYFFYVEPSRDLLLNIQSQLCEQELPKNAVILDAAHNWRSKVSDFFSLSLLVTRAGAVTIGLLILLTINFVLWRLVTVKNRDEVAQAITDAREINTSLEAGRGTDSAALNDKKADDIPPSKNSEAGSHPELSTLIKTADNSGKAEIEKASKTTGKITARKKHEPLEKAGFPAEKQPRFLKLQNLETETANQIEKIEFLLRSFRNAQVAEDGETFDLAYEKQQARKLLERNTKLRQTAETYGTLYAVDALSKAEPMLIEIANLESSPEPEKVLEIKERLRKKNLIVSLQAY